MTKTTHAIATDDQSLNPWHDTCRHCGHTGEIGIDIWFDRNGNPACDSCIPLVCEG